jgi:K+-sensing histidine kinase KdpD
MIDDIAGDAGRLLGIIENLLLLTRLEAGATPDLEPQVLPHVVRGSVEAFRRRHPGRTVRLSGARLHSIVEADRTYLEILVGNLLANADKYSPPETPIEVDVRADGGEVQVSVLDRGIGIGRDEADDVFSPFYRGREARRAANGIGIGLAVCRLVAETQGGRVWARPRPRGGADVGFAIPLSPELVPAD